ncbi:MAG: hypothetical protein DCF12_02780 [Snowella sp.]|jgi:hypothetical protein|nr:MAG: hypothetical protein DCF12_02780 [Snowella sp.]
MSKTLSDVLQKLPLERREKIANRSAKLVYEILNNNDNFCEDLDNKYVNINPSNSQEQKVTFYLFPEVIRHLRIVSAIEADSMAEIIKKSILLYILYKNTLGEKKIDFGEKYKSFDRSQMAKISIYLPDSLFKKITDFTGSNNELISYFMAEAFEFCKSKTNYDFNHIESNSNDDIGETDLNRAETSISEKILI